MVVGPYYVCLRLIATVGSHWQAIDVQAALQGVNLWDLPIDRFLNALRQWLLSHIPHDSVDEVVRQLDTPPGSGQRRVSDLERAKDAEAFEQFAGMLGVMKPAK